MRKKLKTALTKNTNLEKKVIGFITFFILIFAVVISLLFISSLRKNMILQATQNVIYNSKTIADNFSKLFNDYYTIGITLNNCINKRVLTEEKPPPSLFDAQRIKRSKDGAIRIDDENSGAFLAKGNNLNYDLLKYFFFSKRSFEVLGPIAKTHFFNFYFITEDNFIRITPKDWALQIEADHNFGNDIFYKIADPENNPQRTPQWTPLYFDSIWKRWMTSLIIPLYDEDDFIGVTGSDIFLNTMFDNIVELKEKTGMFQTILFDSRGNILVHPEYRDEILKKTAEMNSLLNLKNIKDPFVSEIITRTLQQDTISDEISSIKHLSNTHYYSSQKISTMDWHVCVYVSRSEILRHLYGSIIKILGFSIILVLLIIVILRIFLKKFILKRISTLGGAVSKISGGDLNSQIEVINNDEMGILESGFADMQNSLINQFEKLKITGIELKKREKKYRTLIETTSEGFWLIDIDTKTIDVNQSFCNMLGYSRDEMIGKTPMDFVDEKNSKIFTEKIILSKDTEHRDYEISLKKKNGTNIPTIFNATTILGENGKSAGSFAFIKDITERKKINKMLIEERDKAQQYLDITAVMLISVNFSGIVTLINPKGCEILGYTKEEIIGKDYYDNFLPLRLREDTRDFAMKVFSGGKKSFGYQENEILTKSGEEKLLAWNNVELKDDDGKIIGVLSSAEDITERKKVEEENIEKSIQLEKQFEESEKQRIATLVILNDLNKTTKDLKSEIEEHKLAEIQIKKNLNEKSTLLQEIFHRTKNNMQLISAMLSMQARRSKNEYVNTTFKEIINKIRSMSLVHQKLYQAQDLSNINLKEYIEDLMSLLTQSYGSQEREVSFKFDMENVFILMDSAVPMGLILNELVSNVFKHAFPDIRKGEICISLYKEKDGLIDLRFDDNGVGVPKNFDIKEECSMGLNTVFNLVEHQLNGKVNVDTANGLQWHITFRDNLHKERV